MVEKADPVGSGRAGSGRVESECDGDGDSQQTPSPSAEEQYAVRRICRKEKTTYNNTLNASITDSST